MSDSFGYPEEWEKIYAFAKSEEMKKLLTKEKRRKMEQVMNEKEKTVKSSLASPIVLSLFAQPNSGKSLMANLITCGMTSMPFESKDKKSTNHVTLCQTVIQYKDADFSCVAYKKDVKQADFVELYLKKHKRQSNSIEALHNTICSVKELDKDWASITKFEASGRFPELKKFPNLILIDTKGMNNESIDYEEINDVVRKSNVIMNIGSRTGDNYVLQEILNAMGTNQTPPVLIMCGNVADLPQVNVPMDTSVYNKCLEELKAAKSAMQKSIATCMGFVQQKYTLLEYLIVCMALQDKAFLLTKEFFFDPEIRMKSMDRIIKAACSKSIQEHVESVYMALSIAKQGFSKAELFKKKETKQLLQTLENTKKNAPATLKASFAGLLNSILEDLEDTNAQRDSYKVLMKQYCTLLEEYVESFITKVLGPLNDQDHGADLKVMLLLQTNEYLKETAWPHIKSQHNKTNMPKEYTRQFLCNYHNKIVNAVETLKIVEELKQIVDSALFGLQQEHTEVKEETKSTVSNYCEILKDRVQSDTNASRQIEAPSGINLKLRARNHVESIVTMLPHVEHRAYVKNKFVPNVSVQLQTATTTKAKFHCVTLNHTQEGTYNIVMSSTTSDIIQQFSTNLNQRPNLGAVRYVSPHFCFVHSSESKKLELGYRPADEKDERYLMFYYIPTQLFTKAKKAMQELQEKYPKFSDSRTCILVEIGNRMSFEMIMNSYLHLCKQYEFTLGFMCSQQLQSCCEYDVQLLGTKVTTLGKPAFTAQCMYYSLIDHAFAVIHTHCKETNCKSNWVKSLMHNSTIGAIPNDVLFDELLSGLFDKAKYDEVCSKTSYYYQLKVLESLINALPKQEIDKIPEAVHVFRSLSTISLSQSKWHLLFVANSHPNDFLVEKKKKNPSDFSGCTAFVVSTVTFPVTGNEVDLVNKYPQVLEQKRRDAVSSLVSYEIDTAKLSALKFTAFGARIDGFKRSECDPNNVPKTRKRKSNGKSKQPAKKRKTETVTQVTLPMDNDDIAEDEAKPSSEEVQYFYNYTIDLNASDDEDFERVVLKRQQEILLLRDLNE